MHCASCAKLIERSLTKTNGVTGASVNYGSEEAFIDVASPATLATVKETITQLGYTPVMEQDAVAAEEKKEKSQKSYIQKTTKRVIWSGIATIFVLLLSIPEMVGYKVSPSLEPYIILVSAFFASIVQFYGGMGFYQAAISGLRTGTTSMDTLIVMGTSVAYGYSVFHFMMTILGRAAGLPKAMFFESSTVVITLVLLGKLLEAKAKQTATTALREITKMESPTAHLVNNLGTVTIEAQVVRVGNILEIKPGERIPADGKVIEGESAVDESMLTGESLPVTKLPKDELTAGTINGNGVLRMQVTAIGKDTVLSHIQNLVRDAQNAKPDIARLADSISGVFVPIVLGVAGITALSWIVMGFPIDAIGKTIAVLVVACPCALGLATPMAVIAGVGRAAKAGILIRTAHAMEKAGTAGYVVFDKTGTITKGKPMVTQATIMDKTALSAVLAVESASEHPLASAILSWATAKNIKFTKKATSIRAVPGKGIEGYVGKNHILIGTNTYLKEQNIVIPISLQEAYGTTVLGAVDGKFIALFSIDDPIRSEAKGVVAMLRNQHITPLLLSGDKRRFAEEKAKVVGIHDVVAEVLPEQKQKTIENLRKKYHKPILMVGDGVNDAPALAAADVGIAIGSGSAVAKATADMTILANNLNRIPFMIHLSRMTMATIKQNLAWAFGYNIILIPVAAGVFSFMHITLTPPMAAFAMAASSLSVVLNSLRLSRVKIPSVVS